MNSFRMFNLASHRVIYSAFIKELSLYSNWNVETEYNIVPALSCVHMYKGGRTVSMQCMIWHLCLRSTKGGIICYTWWFQWGLCLSWVLNGEWRMIGCDAQSISLRKIHSSLNEQLHYSYAKQACHLYCQASKYC